MNTEPNIKLQFNSVEKERKTFYLRTISRLSLWGLPIGGLAYVILVNIIGLTLLTIILSVVIAISFNWVLTKSKMYNLYGWPGKPKTSIFDLDQNDFAITLGNKIKKFEYTDISRIETIGSLLIIWLKKRYKHNNKPIAIPVYSTAFEKIQRKDFINILNSKISPITDFYPVIDA